MADYIEVADLTGGAIFSSLKADLSKVTEAIDVGIGSTKVCFFLFL